MDTRKASIIVEMRVRDTDLWPARQRVALARLLFVNGDRRLSAEELHEEVLDASVSVSLTACQ